MSFYEYYSMNMPMFFPHKNWMYRTVFHKEGNLGTTLKIYDHRSPFQMQEEGSTFLLTFLI